ncbi:Bcr/CflA family efflux MFS transporter [Prosthecomicrobium pneumaticum]|uniref:Bcr/CflA family efflux transporter n=1 Tax=Prosthecomicrobium pneumaticum TaxID=81895 RepID=A0A7W9CW43_9HYPH|nr:Bcr/CflA family efflux MFS transporter [Prosthecomicrobium pneumaticum]MBB5752754.1 DHA1 family bicyclomycin/chloramphenicol resistance-like MFS transporter [Prosthecomicrobium pneumaticum]
MNQHVSPALAIDAPVPPRPPVPLWLLALFVFSGTVAMHIFVPALPAAGAALAASPAAMQMTVSLYILGLAFGQLIYGPIADRFGRRPALIGGLVLYALAGGSALLATSVEALVAARLFQALGGCAGLVISRAVVRDTSAPTDAARRLALMNLMVMVGPGVAPVLGGFLSATVGWRSIFLVTALFGLVNLALAWGLLPETGIAGPRRARGALMRDYLGLLRSPAFLGFAVGGSCATTSMYAFVAAAPFIFVHQLGRPDYEVGLYLAGMMLGVWFGSVAASRLIGRIPLGRLAVAANAASVVAAFVFLAAALAGALSVPLVLGAMIVFNIGVGISAPVALAQAVSVVDPRIVGSASGLYGAAQMAIGALCAALAGLGADPALAAAAVLAAAGLIAQAGFWLALRRRPGEAAGA